MFFFFNSRAAVIASSRVSPGINRETLLFTNVYRLARSLNQRFCDAAKSNARVAPIGVLSSDYQALHVGSIHRHQLYFPKIMTLKICRGAEGGNKSLGAINPNSTNNQLRSL